MVKVQDTHRVGGQALIIQAPQPPGAITEPDHLGSLPNALAHGFKPQPGLERLHIPQDRHQPTGVQPGDDLASPRAMLAQAGQHAHFDFLPASLPCWLAARGAKRDHHPISAQHPRSRCKVGRQRLWCREVAVRQRVQVVLEGLHRPLPSRLHPSPHGLRTDGPSTVPPQQARGGGKRHKDGEGTPQILEFPARPLLRLHAQRVVQGRNLRDRTALGTASHPALPPDRATHARDLAWGEALTPQGRPTHRTGRPSRRPARPLGEYGFDHVDREHTGYLPRGQNQRGEGVGIFYHTEQPLHRRIIIAYAVAQA